MPNLDFRAVVLSRIILLQVLVPINMKDNRNGLSYTLPGPPISYPFLSMQTTFTSPPLSQQSYTFDPRDNGYPLLTTVKRYWNPASPYLSDPDAFTLILTHGTGFHKEQWEPTIEDLYRLVEQTGPKHRTQPKIREIWSIDWPNHGDAAILNEKTLQWGYQPSCTCISFQNDWPWLTNALNRSKLAGKTIVEVYMHFLVD